MDRPKVAKSPLRGAVVRSLSTVRSSRAAARAAQRDAAAPPLGRGLDQLWADLQSIDGPALRWPHPSVPTDRNVVRMPVATEGLAPVIPLGAVWSYDHWAGTEHPWATVGPGPLADVVDLAAYRQRRQRSAALG